MSTSAFTFDAWDDVLSAMERLDSSAPAPPSLLGDGVPSSTPSSGAALSTPSTHSSGEFHAFSLIGSTLTGGGYEEDLLLVFS